MTTLLDPTETRTAQGREEGVGQPGLAVPPVIGRFAGLPAKVLDPFASPPCTELLLAREALEEDIAEARKNMVKAIEESLTEHDASARRFLLAVKRDCYNGRPIRKYREKEVWSDLLEISPGLAERIAILEDELAVSSRKLAAVYESELVRQRRHLLGLVTDTRFMRGVALGRPGLVHKIRARAPSLVESGFAKRPAKWEQSLLRFATRAAAKLSANSTLTSYALGSIRRSPCARRLYFDRAPRKDVSLVRINRPQVEQLQTLLLCHPAVRRHSLVAWNDSVEELEPGRFRYLRDGHWKLEPAASELQYVKPVRIRVTLSSSDLDVAREVLREGVLRYDDFLNRLEAGRPPLAEVEGDARVSLERFLELGLLLLLPPWPTHEPWLEQRISRFLCSIADKEPGVHEIAEAVAELVKLEEAYATTPHPESSVVEMEEAFSRLMHTAAPLAGHHGHLVTRARFYEDVLCEAASDPGDDRGVFEIASPTFEEILKVVRVISRFDSLFNLRHDVQHTLAAWWRERAPIRRRVAFNELAEEFAPIWKEFLRFYGAAKNSPLDSFDPLSSPAVAALQEKRGWLISETREMIGRSPEKDFISSEALARLLETLPRRYAPLVGASVFLQPADAEGSLWVLNNVTEGTGRYLSRVVPALQSPRRGRFLEHLVARSVIEVEGEEADLLEVKYPWIQLVRAHPPQAARVLELRGLHLDLPRERRLSLDELTVEADLDAETFRLLDRSGRRVLPASLSTMSDSGLPNRLRFLLSFGPGEARGIFPFAWSEGDEDLTAFNRLTCDKVVTRRRAWKIAVASLRKLLERATDLDAYVLVNRWRRHLGLPDEGYYHELASCGREKPQLVRFDSPSLCRLFAYSLRGIVDGALHFTESLPASADVPLDARGERRGFELLIDQLAIRDLGGKSSPS